MADSPLKTPNKERRCESQLLMISPCKAPSTAPGGSRRTMSRGQSEVRHTKNVYPDHGLTVHQVAGIKAQGPFGFEPYVCPKRDLFPRAKSFGKNRSKPKCFTEKAALEKKWVPGAKYVKHPEWKGRI